MIENNSDHVIVPANPGIRVKFLWKFDLQNKEITDAEELSRLLSWEDYVIAWKIDPKDGSYTLPVVPSMEDDMFYNPSHGIAFVIYPNGSVWVPNLSEENKQTFPSLQDALEILCHDKRYQALLR